MDVATRVNIWLCILSVLLAAISLITVIITLIQNRKMIESSTRPIISVYSQEIILQPNMPSFYIVIKNYGGSVAYMKSFSYDYDFVGGYGIDSPKDYLNEMNHAVLAPGQSKICHLDTSKINKAVTFDIEYQSETGKNYSGHFTVDLKAGTLMPSAKMGREGSELSTISYTLQEMLQKSL